MRYHFNQFVLDTDSHLLFKDDAEVHLERKVFEVLLALIESRGQVMTKDDLIEGVWKGRIISDAAIATCIAAARKAVGDDGHKQSVIKTHNRIGFRFIADVNLEGGMPSIEEPSRPVASTPERPSLAVLSFKDVQNPGTQSLLGSGMTDEIVGTLSKSRWLFLIAASSSLTYDEYADTEARKVAAELGVQYILRGSFLTDGNQIRTTSTLEDGHTGDTFANFKFDRDINTLFEVIDDIASRVVGELLPMLSTRELNKMRGGVQRDWNAWQLYLAATELLRTHSVSDTQKAEILLKEAIALEPQFAVAHARLATCYLYDGYYGWSDLSKEELAEQAIAHAMTARSSDPYEALACDALASAFQLQDKHLDAEHWAKEAIAMCSTCVPAYSTLVTVLAQQGKAEEALNQFQRLQTVSPRDPDLSGALLGAAIAYFIQGDLQACVEAAQQHVVLRPNWYGNRLFLAAALALLGQKEAAAEAVRQLRNLVPWMTLSAYRSHTKLRRPDDVELVVKGLAIAGLPD